MNVRSEPRIGDDESPLAATEVHYLASDHVGDEFKLFVDHCGARRTPSGSLSRPLQPPNHETISKR